MSATRLYKILNKGSFVFVLVMMAQLQLWDGLITQVMVNCGLVNEFNQLVANDIAKGNFIFIKIACVILSVFLLWIINKHYPALAKITANVIILLYIGIITWNFITFFAV